MKQLDVHCRIPFTKSTSIRSVCQSYTKGSHCLQSLALSGCTVNLVIFLVRKMQQKNSSAANVYTNWTGTSFLTSIIGGAIGDAYWGRLWTSIFCQLVYIVGLIMFSLIGTIITAENNLPQMLHVVLLYVALYTMGLGNASLTPNAVSLGADQFDLSNQSSTFISMSIASSAMGLMFSTSIISYIENEGQWRLGFWLSAGFGVMGLLLFLAGMPKMRQHKAGENPLFCIGRVLYACICSQKSDRLSSPKEFNKRGTNFRWLDKASTLKQHHMCTLQQVQAVKGICFLLPFWVCGIIVASVLAQKSTLFMLQGDTMENLLWGNIRFPPGSMSLFSLIMVVMCTPAYTILIEPYARRYNRGNSSIVRMGSGLIIAIILFCIAAIIEARRLKISHIGEESLTDGTKVSMSIFWLVPQYVLDGLITALWGCGHLEFNYIYAPQGMRSLATALSLSDLALGNYLSSLLLGAVTTFTSWIPDDLNHGHLDYFYWLLAGLLVIDLILFVVASKWVVSTSKQLWFEGHPGHDVQEVDLLA
ncbi:hypothetical protein KP509_14G036700 [Ceratopteris richardii]|uniref:Uncharacterized protein n=1 Tax=Ceratopteris richardii TaxID=49495 RepID=A0A8T2T902_CERRI|nr:hypothetical protein KP509_14G036700 [Ceratopteris richardii]